MGAPGGPGGRGGVHGGGLTRAEGPGGTVPRQGVNQTGDCVNTRGSKIVRNIGEIKCRVGKLYDHSLPPAFSTNKLMVGQGREGGPAPGCVGETEDTGGGGPGRPRPAPSGTRRPNPGGAGETGRGSRWMRPRGGPHEVGPTEARRAEEGGSGCGWVWFWGGVAPHRIVHIGLAFAFSHVGKKNCAKNSARIRKLNPESEWRQSHGQNF